MRVLLQILMARYVAQGHRNWLFIQRAVIQICIAHALTHLLLQVTLVVRRRSPAGYVDRVFDGLAGNWLIHKELVLLS